MTKECYLRLMEGADIERNAFNKALMRGIIMRAALDLGKLSLLVLGLWLLF